MSDERTANQTAEFATLTKLGAKFRALMYTPVVDDDYPAVRHEYESALLAFVDAMKKNGRQL